MWALHLSAKTYSQSPSELFGIRNRPLAWMFNDRVLEFGIHVENKAAERTKKGEPVHKMIDLLTDRETTADKGKSNAQAAAKLMQMAGVKVVE